MHHAHAHRIHAHFYCDTQSSVGYSHTILIVSRLFSNYLQTFVSCYTLPVRALVCTRMYVRWCARVCVCARARVHECDCAVFDNITYRPQAAPIVVGDVDAVSNHGW